MMQDVFNTPYFECLMIPKHGYYYLYIKCNHDEILLAMVVAVYDSLFFVPYTCPCVCFWVSAGCVSRRLKSSILL